MGQHLPFLPPYLPLSPYSLSLSLTSSHTLSPSFTLAAEVFAKRTQNHCVLDVRANSSAPHNVLIFSMSDDWVIALLTVFALEDEQKPY